MKYLLDTNTCIRYLNGRSADVIQKIRATPASEIVVCSVVRAELAYGAAKSQTPEQSFDKQSRFLEPYGSLSFDDAAALVFGRIRAGLAQAGTPIGPYDLQIAAIALTHDLIVITHNTAEFFRIPGLRVEDWEAS